MNTKKFNIGLFGINASSGLSLTKIKKRWMADWDEIKKLVLYCDKNNFDFILPLSKWKDWGGVTKPNLISYETFNFASLLGMLTKKIFFFSTVHVPFIHPVYAARCLGSITTALKGRNGINIVCGWNEDEFKMFSDPIKDFSSQRYIYGSEWLKIFKSLINQQNPYTNFKGKFFKITKAQCFPKSFVQPHPPIVSAAYSSEGREFAIKNCDILFTMFDNFERTKKINEDLLNKAKKLKKKIKIFTPIHIICRQSRLEADDFHHLYAKKQQDNRAVYNFVKNVAIANKKALYKIMKEKSDLIAASCGSRIIKGSPKDVVEQLRELKNAKFSGAAFSFVNYFNEIKYFQENVLSKKPF